VSYGDALARVRARAKPSPGVRLLWTAADGSEHFRDFATISEAREITLVNVKDWVIVERTVSGKYGAVGRVLESSDSCPKREDGHCRCWWDEKPCCGCGAI